MNEECAWQTNAFIDCIGALGNYFDIEGEVRMFHPVRMFLLSKEILIDGMSTFPLKYESAKRIKRCIYLQRKVQVTARET